LFGTPALKARNMLEICGAAWLPAYCNLSDAHVNVSQPPATWEARPKSMAEAESKACTSQKTNPLFTNDVGSRQGKATEEMIDFWAQGSSEECQHLQKEGKNYISQKDGNKLRCWTSSLFHPQYLNCEKVIRSWLCFSPEKGKLYCFVYKLFNESRNEGFSANGTLIRRMHLELYLRTKYLPRIKMLLYQWLLELKRLVALITILQNKLMRNGDSMRHCFLWKR